MKILEELKLALVEEISQTHLHIKNYSPKLINFLKLSTELMAEAETAVDLSQSLRLLIQEQLNPGWFNPRWYFSNEYQLRATLLEILNRPSFSLLNLLIQTNKEDRKLIHELERERIQRQDELRQHGISPALITNYELRIKSYTDRHEIDQRRCVELNAATYKLIEENARLRSEAPAAQLLRKLAQEPGFTSFLSNTALTPDEQSWITRHLSPVSETQHIPSKTPSARA